MVKDKDKDNSSNSLVFGRWPQTKSIVTLSTGRWPSRLADDDRQRGDSDLVESCATSSHLIFEK